MRNLIAFLLMSTFIGPISADSYTFMYEGMAYGVSDFENRTCYTTYDDNIDVPYDLVIPDSVTDGVEWYTVNRIGAYSFSEPFTNRYIHVRSIRIPASVKSIGNWSFIDNPFVEEVIIEGSLDSISHEAFRGCEKLKTVEFGAPVKKLQSYAFAECLALKEIQLSDSLYYIGPKAFSGCTALKSFHIPSSVTEFGDKVLYGCSSLEEINVDPDNPILESKDGVLFQKGGHVLLNYPAGNERQVYSVPESVSFIADGAFLDNRTLSSVILPDSLVEIGESAFENCSGIESVDLPLSLSHIGERAFFNCSALKSVSSINKAGIPDIMGVLGYSAFAQCPSLESVTLPASIYTIKWRAFHQCTALKTIHFPEYLGEIGANAFSECTALKSITFPEKLQRLRPYAFSQCTALDSVIIPPKVYYIPFGAFEECVSMVKVVLPESVRHICSYAFKNCTSLAILEIHGAVSFIDCPVWDEDFDWRHSGPGYPTPDGYRIWDGCESLRKIYYSGNNLYDFYDNCFLPQIYHYATLYIREDLIDLLNYRDGWKKFTHVEAYDFSGIDTVVTDTDTEGIDFSQPYEVYTISGQKVGTSTEGVLPGIYILRQGNRTQKFQGGIR